MTQRILELRAALLSIEIQVQGMIAENKQREHAGKSMAYVEHDFQNMAQEVENLRGVIRNL